MRKVKYETHNKSGIGIVTVLFIINILTQTHWTALGLSISVPEVFC